MLGSNVGIDLGTTSIIIYLEGKGIVVNEPCAIAYDEDNRILCVGKNAEEMSERNHDGIRVVHPMADGVISDFTATKHIVSYFLSRVCKNMIFRPNVVVCVPSMVTNLEKRTVLSLINAAGAAKACLIEEPLAAALGAGLQSDRPKGVLVVDIGGGTTDVAIITMGCISISRSVRTAGNEFNEAIIRQLRRERDFVIGERTAEQIKEKIGSATLRDTELAMTVKGKSYLSNTPCTFEVTSTEVFLAMRPKLEIILDTIRKVLEEAPPDLAADIIDSGIYLTGGSARLRYLDKMIERKTGIKTKAVTEPEKCVALGTGKALADMDILANNGYVFKARTGKEKSESAG